MEPILHQKHGLILLHLVSLSMRANSYCIPMYVRTWLVAELYLGIKPRAQRQKNLAAADVGFMSSLVTPFETKWHHSRWS